MKKLILSTLLLSGVVASTGAYAFPLSFAQALCTLQPEELDRSVYDFQDKLEWVRRFEAAGSQYRKHVERHTFELIEAFDSALKQPACTKERKARIEQLKAEIERTYQARKI